jgi:HD-GYP domain-containing protein (c-di-GMP phosphodiesterase class II)
MSTITSTSIIAVDELRVGMYIHLEGGWLSHPFPLSAFRISTPDEILTLRRLGLARVRWVPEKSDLSVRSRPGALAAVDPGSPGLAGAAGIGPDGAAEAQSGAPNGAAPTAEERAAQLRQAWLAEQRQAAQRCERQYGEAAVAWRSAWEAAATQPERAGQTAADLTQAMLAKMLDAEDVGIRLVSGGGDRMAAHALNVAVVSMLIGRTLGLGGDDMLDLGVGALMHDVGKQDLPDRARHADEAFGSAEMNLYREHVAKGVLRGRAMGLSAGALAVLAQHHENADGSGFPFRLTVDRMALGARIVAIVNRYDNLCNPPSRALALTPHEAVSTLFAQGRTRFDGAALNAFIRMMGVYPAGSLVQLTDDRYGMVMGVNSTRPLKPRVLVHSALRGRAPTKSEAQLIDLETEPDLGIRRSLAPAKLPPAVLSALDPRPRVAYYFEPLSHRAPAEELAA